MSSLEDHTSRICELCGEEVDNEDSDEDGTIQVNEWLFVDPQCSKCQRKGCYKCLKTCYSCANVGEDSETICKECATTNKILFKNKCRDHKWWECEGHKKDTCGECRANKNYDRYGY